jgi:hypothetical protein
MRKVSDEFFWNFVMENDVFGIENITNTSTFGNSSLTLFVDKFGNVGGIKVTPTFCQVICKDNTGKLTAYFVTYYN